MGSIISKPKAPAPLPITQPELAASPTEAELAAQKAAERKEADKAKAAELARSRRGRASTINTSLRGLLQDNSLQPRRKTLLGE